MNPKVIGSYTFKLKIFDSFPLSVSHIMLHQIGLTALKIIVRIGPSELESQSAHHGVVNSIVYETR